MVPPPLKILVVDDEQLLLTALKRAGHKHSLEIATAETMDQALDEIKRCHFDLFLLDLEWHNRHGVELLRRIDEYCPYIPVIIMTTDRLDACSQNETIRTVRRHGACHVLEKPFRLDRMMHLIESIFHDHDLLGSSQDAHGQSPGQEKRDRFRRPHVQSVTFSFNKIIEGSTESVTAKGILTDISDFGTGILSSIPIPLNQVIRFEDGFVKRNGIVAWSTMIAKDTCRFGVQFC